MSEEQKPCRYCREPVAVNAVKCPHCHEYLHAGLKRHLESIEHRDSSMDGWAALATVFIPGLGHILKGHIGVGIAWMIATWLLCFVFVGFIIWIWLIFRAYRLDVVR